MKKIPVFTYDDDKCQDVPDYLLGELIAAGRIRSFRRASGWVVIGRDPIRELGKRVEGMKSAKEGQVK